MSEALERIWAISDRRRNWTDEKPAGPSECHSIEYIRKDVSDALVAAAYENAADKIWSGLMRHSPLSDYENGYLEGVSAAYKLIKELDSADACASLDRIRQEAREEALREALKAVEEISWEELRDSAADIPLDYFDEGTIAAFKVIETLITKDADNG